MIVLLDNYDSFTFNLLDYLQQLGLHCAVKRNDATSVEEIRALQPSGIVISPGPKTPLEAGISNQLISELGQDTPILGICLGHQAIGMGFGATLHRLPYPVHGKTSLIHHDGSALFRDVPNPFQAMRYHSLMLKDADVRDITITARTEDDVIMALRHNEKPLYGLQFHPESVLTPDGLTLLNNWKEAYGIV